MAALQKIAEKHNLIIIEDACQAQRAEWRGRMVGTWGLAGCFSFQASKNLNAGEGGAILTDDDALAARCYAFHNNSRPLGSGQGLTYGGGRGANLLEWLIFEEEYYRAGAPRRINQNDGRAAAAQERRQRPDGEA